MHKLQCLLLPPALRIFAFCLLGCLLLASWLFNGFVKPALVLWLTGTKRELQSYSKSTLLMLTKYRRKTDRAFKNLTLEESFCMLISVSFSNVGCTRDTFFNEKCPDLWNWKERTWKAIILTVNFLSNTGVSIFEIVSLVDSLCSKSQSLALKAPIFVYVHDHDSVKWSILTVLGTSNGWTN